MKNASIFLATLLLLLSVFLTANWRTMDFVHEKNYDLFNINEPVESSADLKRLLNHLPQVSYEDLADEYKKFSKSNRKKYKAMLQGEKYYKVHRHDLNKYIVGDFRMKEFMPKDKYYKKCIKDDDFVYWLMDEKLLTALLNLQQELEEGGYDKCGFTISNAHRHPRENERIGGAKMSRHMKGQAIDLSIGDINGDGKYTKKDKDIVLKICDEKVIANNGGIGRYPGTRTVHIDVRGKRARWDSF